MWRLTHGATRVITCPLGGKGQKELGALVVVLTEDDSPVEVKALRNFCRILVAGARQFQVQTEIDARSSALEDLFPKVALKTTCQCFCCLGLQEHSFSTFSTCSMLQTS